MSPSISETRKGMPMDGERGSALVITLLLLLILTAIGIYAISVSTTEMDVTLQAKMGTVTLQAAEAGAYFGVDRVPAIVTSLSPGALWNGASYTVTTQFTGQMNIVPGYGSGYRFADFQVDSRADAPPQYVAQRAVEALVNYGPVLVGTMY